MGVKLDLKKIALHARNAEYNPKRFAAVIMRIRFEDFSRGAIVILIGSWTRTWHYLEWISDQNFISIDTGSQGQQRSYSALARWCALVLSLKRTAGELCNCIYFSSFSITSIFPSFLDANYSALGLLPESMPELCRSWDFPPSLKTLRSRTWWVYFWYLVTSCNHVLSGWFLRCQISYSTWGLGADTLTVL